jgi:S1-C subfamily serine protease
MRSAARFCTVVAILALGLAQLQARDEKKEEKKADAKKDEQVKGKIPEDVRKRIEEKKIAHGVVIIEVTPDGPATAGRNEDGQQVLLEKGDIITKVNDKAVKTADDFYKLMGGNDERKVIVIDVNTGDSQTIFFKPKDGLFGVKFEVITPPAT